ncbi:MAG: sporulation protein YqfC [Clostridiales bacterium]|nr:sporulation protein YqfC [Clostridiales bacterium]
MKKITEAAAGLWGVPKDVMMDTPHISLSADREVYVENHKGLVALDERRIVLASKAGEIVISGEKLGINRMTCEQILIEGFIKSVEFRGIYKKEGKNVK